LSAAVTLKDVARLAGVSTTTVSRTLSNPQRVNSETRERVQQAAEAIGYTGNEMARSLRQKDTRTIGLIISDILNPFHAQVAGGLERYASERGYSAILCHSDEDVNKERASLELLRRHRVVGIVLEPTEGCRVEVEAIVRSGIPVVEVDRVSGATGAASVLSDNIGGAAVAARYLLSLGHRRIATIAGDQQLTSGRERLEGFRAALGSAGISVPDAWIVTGRYTDDDGYSAAQTLFSAAGTTPTALFVANIEMTVGALQAIRELGLRIPEDVSVISFDDARWATLITPPLTVIAQEPDALGRTAARLILDAVIRPGQPLSPTVHRLPTHLIARGSCLPWTDRSRVPVLQSPTT
jgi:DNA-binding LacI/PurR family transcriptional regulator